MKFSKYFGKEFRVMMKLQFVFMEEDRPPVCWSLRLRLYGDTQQSKTSAASCISIQSGILEIRLPRANASSPILSFISLYFFISVCAGTVQRCDKGWRDIT